MENLDLLIRSNYTVIVIKNWSSRISFSILARSLIPVDILQYANTPDDRLYSQMSPVVELLTFMSRAARDYSCIYF